MQNEKLIFDAHVIGVSIAGATGVVLIVEHLLIANNAKEKSILPCSLAGGRKVPTVREGGPHWPSAEHRSLAQHPPCKHPRCVQLHQHTRMNIAPILIRFQDSLLEERCSVCSVVFMSST
jgi:hypothetical protein